jgi:nicotinate-nucleotide adenylyltransferase
MARKARELLALDEVLFVPVLRPSHKADAVAGFPERLQMVSLLLAGESGLAVSDLETRLGSPSYTVNLLTELGRQRGPDTLLFFIVGADSLEQFHLWFRYREILALARLVVLGRPGFSLQNPHLAAQDWANIILLPGLASPDASHRFREGAEAHLPDAVEQFIRQHGLYR